MKLLKIPEIAIRPFIYNVENNDSNDILSQLESLYYPFILKYLKPQKKLLDIDNIHINRLFKYFITILPHELLNNEQYHIIDNILLKYEQDNGIQFHDLLLIFHEINNHPKLINTFNSLEISNLVNHFKDLSDDIKHGINSNEFIKIYEKSLERTLIARKLSHEVLSGGFVSLILQIIGIFDENQFYLPSDFAQQISIQHNLFDQIFHHLKHIEYKDIIQFDQKL